MTPKDTDRSIAGLEHISHDADAFTSVFPCYGGKSGGRRSAEYADSTLTPDAMAVTAVVLPVNTGCIALHCLSYDAEACTGVLPEHGGSPSSRRSPGYADSTLTVDAG